MSNTATVITTKAGEALIAQMQAENKVLVIDKFIFANVPNRPAFPDRDDVVPVEHVVHESAVHEQGRLTENSVIYSTTLASNVGPFSFNWSGLFCSEHNVLVAINFPPPVDKTVDAPGITGNTLVRSFVLEYKGIAETTNITVDPSSWQYDAHKRMSKMDNDTAQAIIDQNGKDWFIDDGFIVTPQSSAYSIKAGAGYVSGHRISLDFDRIIQVPEKPAFIYVDAFREGSPTGEWQTKFTFVVAADEKDDYTDAQGVNHFVCKIAQVFEDGSVGDLRSISIVEQQLSNGIISISGLKIWPDKLDANAKVGDIVGFGGYNALRFNGRAYIMDPVRTGGIVSFDLPNGTVTFESGASELLRMKDGSRVITPSMFSQNNRTGLPGIADDDAWDRCVKFGLQNKLRIELDSDVNLSTGYTVVGKINFTSNGHHFRPVAKALYNDDYIIQFGFNYAGSCKGVIDQIDVDCEDTIATGIQFGHTSGLKCGFAKVINHNGHGIKHAGGYELTIKWETIASSGRLDVDGKVLPKIQDSTNIGFLSTTSDSIYHVGHSIGCDVGMITRGGNNTVISCHHWSTYRFDARPMRACFIDLGENNNLVNCMADSPSLLDFNSPASELNGGYGLYTPYDGDGYGNKYPNFTCFIPTVNPDIGAPPVGRIVSAYVGRAALEYPGFRTIDRTGAAIFKEFDGGYADKCTRHSRVAMRFYKYGQERMHFGGEAQIEFNKLTWFQKGLVQAFQFAESEDSDLAWGMGHHRLVGNWLICTINEGGVTRNIKLEKNQSGTTKQRNYLSLSADDYGYKFFNTSSGIYNVWNSTGWTDMAGAAV